MGYMDLSVGGSDNANVLALDIEEEIIKILKKNINDIANEFNTDGIVNVAMIINELIIPSKYWQSYNDMYEYSKIVVIPKLEKYIVKQEKYYKDNKEDKKNANYHLVEYRKLLKNIKQFISKCEKE